MKNLYDRQFCEEPEMQLLRQYIQIDLEQYFDRLARQDEGYRLVEGSVERDLARLEEKEPHLAQALREDLGQLRRLERGHSFWLGFSRPKE